jgi:DNA-binding response OmpR family regulator
MAAPSILIVEDEKDVREVMAEMMSYFGYDTLIVSSAEEALEILKDRNFDLIITDLGLPGMDGREMVKRIRLDEINTPILVTTGVELDNDKIVFERFGYCDFIQKPFRVDDLNRRISILLKQNNNHVNNIRSIAP